MLDTQKIFPIGMGSWGLGGLAEKNPQNDDKKQLEAISYMLGRGVNLIEATYWYAEGKTVELLAEGIKKSGRKREELFITSTVYPYRNPTLNDATKEVDIVLEKLETEYLDSVLFSLSSLEQWGRDDAKKTLHKLLESEKTRFISVTNFDLSSLKEFYKEFGSSLFSHELHFSFEIRENFDFGITEYADNKGIKNVIFQPLRRNRTANRNWPLLSELSEKYKMTQNQIILNWITSKGFVPLTKSETIAHIDEHINSLDYKIEGKDIERLDKFRPPNWKTPEIDWYHKGQGTPIHQLPNIFDDTYKNG